MSDGPFQTPPETPEVRHWREQYHEAMELVRKLDASLERYASERDSLRTQVETLTKERDDQVALSSSLMYERDEQRTENTRLMSLLGQAMDPPKPTDMRADYLAAWLHLTNAGVPTQLDDKPAAMGERVKLLAASRDEAVKQLGWERDHSKMLSESNGRLQREKAEVETFCAKVRSEYTAAARMHEVATQNAVDLKARVEYVTKGRDAADARLDRLLPLLTVLRSWAWAEIAKDGVLPRELPLEQQVIDAFAAVEKAENEAAKAKERATR